MTNILQELNELLTGLGVPVETGIFKGKPPDEYVVVTPMSDIYGVFADDQPLFETQEARISLFSKQNYTQRKNQIVKALLAAEFTITDRVFIGYDEDNEYFHYVLDVANVYEIESEE
jgi:hypothetical protein